MEGNIVMAVQQIGIIYLRANGFDFYGNKMVNGIRFDFPLTAVKDLDVVNKGELEESISTCIEKNQILTANSIIVISESVCFEKDFVDIPLDQQENLTRAFLENIPFEQINTKTFPIERGEKIVSVNKDLYEAVKTGFENKGFLIEAVAPSLVLGTALGNTEHGLSAEAITILFEKYTMLKENSFAMDEKKQVAEPKKTEENGKRAMNKKLVFLSGIFILLFGILAYMIINTFIIKPA